MRNRYVELVVLLAAISPNLGMPVRAQAPAMPQNGAAGPGAAVGPGKDSQTEKQKMLADEAKRLVDMASDLKTQVAKTNKNILSLEVVRKAEEIEFLARKMKEQARK